MRPSTASLAVATAGLILTTACASVQAQERASYTFYRNGAAVGRHVVQSSAPGPRHTVDVSTHVAVQIANRITLFRYSHQSHETWEGERLVALDSRTDDDGRQHRVLASSGAAGLVVRATIPEVENASTSDRMMSFSAMTTERLVEQVVPGNVLPSSWSHFKIVQQTRLLNSQTGNVMPISVQQLGTDVVQTGIGQIPATRYRLSGMVAPLDIWYDNRGRWLKSAFKGRDGSTIEMILDR